METFDFQIKLTDAVTGPANKAADAVRKVELAAEKASSKLNSRFANQWEKIGFSAERSAIKQRSAFANSWEKIGSAAEKAHKRAEKASERAAEKAAKLKEKNSWTGKLGEELNSHLVSAFAGFELAKGLIHGAERAVEIISEGVKMAFEAAGKHEQLRLSYKLILGKQGGKEAMEDQERFSKNTAFTGSEIGGLMRPLYNAGMKPKAARQAFSTAADLDAKLGGGIEGFVEMMAKIQNKGGVSEKMLLSLGVNIQEFYASVAKATGVKGKVGKSDIEAAKKKATEDKIDPQILLNALTETVNKSQGGAAGTGGKEKSQTMLARLHKLGSLPELYLEKLDDTPAWNAISEKFQSLFQKLSPDSDNGKRIMASITNAFEMIESLVETALKPESIEAFVSGIQRAVDAAGALIAGLREAIDLINGETISKKLFQGDEGDQKLRDIKQKKAEIATGQLTDLEVRQRKNDIASLERGMSPSERADYQRRDTPTKAPLVASNGGGAKVVHVNMHAPITVHAAPGDDPDHTHQKAGEQIRKHVATAVERATAEAGG